MRKLIKAIAIIMALITTPALAQHTALHTAAMAGTAEIINALLEAGADISARNEDGSTAFDLAKEYNREKLEGSDAWWRLNDAQYR